MPHPFHALLCTLVVQSLPFTSLVLITYICPLLETVNWPAVNGAVLVESD